MIAEAFTWRDEDGLLLTPRGTSPARRPPFALEAAQGHALRLSVAGVPVLWVRFELNREDIAFLRTGSGESLRIVPPISMPDVRSAPDDREHLVWWEAWERWFARALIETERSPLYRSRWRIDRPASLRQRGIPALCSAAAAVHAAPCHAESDGPRGALPAGLIALRSSSRPDSGRVTAWRKRVRDGTCPPLLVQYVEMLGKHVVVDGHDRLHACAIEGIEPPYLVLWPELLVPTRYRETDRQSISESAARLLGDAAAPPEKLVEGINGWLLPAFAPCTTTSRSRAYPLRGGLAGWLAEVERRLRELGIGSDADAAEILLQETT